MSSPEDCDLRDVITVIPEPVLVTSLFVTIYLARFQRNATAKLAVKRPRTTTGRDTKTLAERKRKTASAVATLRNAKHPNLAEIYGMHVMDADVCIVTVWAQEGTLAAFLQHASNVPRLTILIEVAAALEYLHSALDNKPPIIHGNLHSGNVLLDANHHALVCDFGLNDVLPSKTDESIVVLPDTLPRGKFIYIAPELHMAGERLSTASDVFSFSILAWDMYTGAPPFLERGMVPAMLAISRGDRPDALTNKNVPTNIARIIVDCWAHAPTTRPGMDAVHTRLAGATETRAIAAPTGWSPLSLFQWPVALLASIRRLWIALRKPGLASGSKRP